MSDRLALVNHYVSEMIQTANHINDELRPHNLRIRLQYALETISVEGEQKPHANTGMLCTECGSADLRANGNCFLCLNCGTTTSCG